MVHRLGFVEQTRLDREADRRVRHGLELESPALTDQQDHRVAHVIGADRSVRDLDGRQRRERADPERADRLVRLLDPVQHRGAQWPLLEARLDQRRGERVDCERRGACAGAPAAEPIRHREHVGAVAERQHRGAILVRSFAAGRAAAEHRHLAGRERLDDHLVHFAVEDAETGVRIRHHILALFRA